MKMQPLKNFTYHWGLHPRIYVAPYTPKPLVIDGNIHKPEWEHVPWSFDFDDIRGDDAPSYDDHPSPQCQTRFKMMWDEDFLYIAAMMKSDMELRATYTERNAPIYHEDSDFEVFVDAASSCHFYKELEMNPINTVWNLMLDKPYMDGGQEHSGRIAEPGDDNYYDVVGQNTEVRILKGKLNIPESEISSQDNEWTVEIALSHQDTLKHTNIRSLKQGDEWRINFSRVEKKGLINWTWQKQRIWDADQCSYLGKVDMHQPNAWGYVRFGPSMDDEDDVFGEVALDDIVEKGAGDAYWPLKLAAMNVYYAQHRYKELNGEFVSDLKALNEFIDPNTLKPFEASINIDASSDSFVVRIQMDDSNTKCTRVVEVKDERLMTAKELDNISSIE